jgi:hypothetical protein
LTRSPTRLLHLRDMPELQFKFDFAPRTKIKLSVAMHALKKTRAFDPLPCREWLIDQVLEGKVEGKLIGGYGGSTSTVLSDGSDHSTNLSRCGEQPETNVKRPDFRRAFSVINVVGRDLINSKTRYDDSFLIPVIWI